MERTRTSGISLWAGEEKLFVRGVTHGPGFLGEFVDEVRRTPPLPLWISAPDVDSIRLRVGRAVSGAAA